jgi:hypothetical protein
MEEIGKGRSSRSRSVVRNVLASNGGGTRAYGPSARSSAASP